MDSIGAGPYVLSVLRAGWEGNLVYGITFGALLEKVLFAILFGLLISWIILKPSFAGVAIKTNLVIAIPLNYQPTFAADSISIEMSLAYHFNDRILQFVRECRPNREDSYKSAVLR